MRVRVKRLANARAWLKCHRFSASRALQDARISQRFCSPPPPTPPNNFQEQFTDSPRGRPYTKKPFAGALCASTDDIIDVTSVSVEAAGDCGSAAAAAAGTSGRWALATELSSLVTLP